MTNIPSVLSAWDAEIVADLAAAEDALALARTSVIAAEEAATTARDLAQAIRREVSGKTALPHAIEVRLGRYDAAARAAEGRVALRRGEVSNLVAKIADLGGALHRLNRKGAPAITAPIAVAAPPIPAAPVYDRIVFPAGHRDRAAA